MTCRALPGRGADRSGVPRWPLVRRRAEDGHVRSRPSPPLADAPVVTTDSGAVLGVRGAATCSFRGIPYAAPPVGPLRFAAPRPPAPWQGVRDARSPAPSSVQMTSFPLPEQAARAIATAGGRSEDCLVLDVHTPADPAAGPEQHASTERLRPVLVWVHGGAFAFGRCDDFDGRDLARSGDVVVVCLNYRLGAFGFVDVHDVLAGTPHAARAATNPGLRDQVAALEWVQRNVVAFGGDPRRVTVAGESAGAASVMALTAAPSTRGLFRGVIASSGTVNMLADAPAAAGVARALAARLGASGERPEALWRASTARVLAAMRAIARERSQELVTRPWWDGDLLPSSEEAGVAAIAERAAQGVAVLAGTNRDEHAFFTRLRFSVAPLDRERMALSLAEQLGPAETARVLAAYPRTRDGLTALGTHALFTVPVNRTLDAIADAGGAAWGYRLDFSSPLLGMGAFHSLDLTLLWPARPLVRRLVLGVRDETQDAPVNAMAQRIAQRWLAFVRDGDPDGPSSVDRAADVSWPRWDAASRPTLLVDERDTVARRPDGARLDRWAQMPTTP